MYKCFVCSAGIPEDRVKFLMECGAIELTCLAHSTTKKIRGIFDGEAGTSNLIFCDKVFNDSVRGKFTEIEEPPDQ